MDCTLCQEKNNESFTLQGKRAFFKCNRCALIFVGRNHLPDPEKERIRYLKHNNSLKDQAYLKFLEQIIEPAQEYLSPCAKILDYGCGPVPVLKPLLEKKGFDVDVYDPFFFPGEFPKNHFDFIFSTEVFEHFASPGKELELLKDLLKKDGFLAVMTEFYPDEQEFQQWHYIRDFTHVAFYSETTFDFICRQTGFKKLFCDGKRRIILQKN